MRKVVVGILVFSLLAGVAYAQVKGNASPCIVVLDSTTKYKNIDFEYPTRDLYIDNYDANTGVWVNLKKRTSTVGMNGLSFYLAPSSSQQFYDFMTQNITISIDSYFAGNGSASPISVIGVF